MRLDGAEESELFDHRGMVRWGLCELMGLELTGEGFQEVDSLYLPMGGKEEFRRFVIDD